MKKKIFRKTKIVATIGPATNKYETLIKLYEKGANVFRLNFSHGTHEDHEQVIKLTQKLNKEMNANIGIMADLQGPKLRIGKIQDNKIELKKNDVVTFTTKSCIGTKARIAVAYRRLPQDVKKGEIILIDDGKIELKILSTNKKDEIKAKVIYGGILSSNKGFNLPETQISASSLTKKDRLDLNFILTQPIDWIALSFVRDVKIVNLLRKKIRESGSTARIISKIEKPQAIKNIDAIIDHSDAIMVARGDLGVEIPFENIPIIQKEIVKKCVEHAKPVIIATQVMESMIDSPRPSRAEITDCANAVLDGADAIMLSGETSIGKYPIEVIKTIDKIVRRTEEETDVYYRNKRPQKNSPTFLSDAICFNACKIAEDVNASVINGMTYSGYTARMIASFRPEADIHIFTSNPKIINTLSLFWGVQVHFYDKFVSTDETILDVINILKSKKKIKNGEVMINTGSMPIKDRGRTNMIKISHIR